ncbi:Bax inhibitor-1/YccA family protein [Candidatus Tisiphia endosymbiont of Nemotelus uliginosus]|uniref:Bax inhibitor-1/YccA family protein n=1 Tax=Candidatus Tisiphia endosymbiont of Nemotelus uliginosus TaxID=3077926 RepID=UPI0035C937AA
MIDYTKTRVFTDTQNKTYDTGLREYMLKMYNYMALALALTGVLAFATNFEPLRSLMFSVAPNGYVGNTGFGTLVMLAPVGIAIYFFMGFGTMKLETTRVLFWAYAALTGMSLGSLGLIYTGESIARTFFICASVFGGMSLYGYSTNRDLTSLGSFFIMGLFGLIIASLVNLFLQSSALYFAVSIIGIGVFMGLIAWDTQKIKSMYFIYGGGELGQKMSIMAAFTLYLDFINLFLHLIRFLGNRRN